MTVWDSISLAVPASLNEREEAGILLEEWLSAGLIQVTQTSLLSLSDNAIAWFFSQLAKKRSTISPVCGFRNSSWMTERDYCFVNVRATGFSEKPGTFIQAAKLLPAIAADAIHLAPFTRYQFEVVYAIESAKTISLNVLDHSLLKSGISAWDQVKAFVEGCHLLGKAVGFDLEPHFAQFARPVIEHPGYFRWIKLDTSKEFLLDSMHADEMYETDIQNIIIQEVEEIRDSLFARFGITTFEYTEFEYETDGTIPSTIGTKKDTAYRTCIRVLIQNGIWPVLSHTWDGVGLPEFVHYNQNGNYPEFQFLDENGENKTRFSTGILTPIAFADGLPANRVPEEDFPPHPKPDSISFYATLFDFWRDTFSFDFVRYDSVDHVFDSTLDPDGHFPTSDRPTPDVLEKAIRHSKNISNPHIGAFAEHIGTEIQQYGSIGFDIILGTDMLKRIDRPHMEEMYELADSLAVFNESRASRCSVAFAIDTHDTGNPLFWGSPLIQCMGFDRMRLRHFISRFCSCGKASRPKYEVMGFQDLSYGLYEANIQDQNLAWKNDARFSASYFLIESTWNKFKSFLGNAVPGPRYVRDGLAWWSFISDSQKEILIVLASLETAEGSDQNEIIINISQFPDGTLNCTEYSFSAEPLNWTFEKTMVYSHLEYLDFRLFHIK